MIAVLSLAFIVVTTPDFELRNSKGDKIRLADYRNKTVVLVFYNQYTSPLANVWAVPIYYKYRDEEDVVFLWISDMQGILRFVFRIYKGTINKSVEKLGIPYPLLDWGGRVSKRYGVNSQWPSVIVIGKDGKIKWKHEIKSPVEPTNELESLLNIKTTEIR